MFFSLWSFGAALKVVLKQHASCILDMNNPRVRRAAFGFDFESSTYIQYVRKSGPQWVLRIAFLPTYTLLIFPYYHRSYVNVVPR